MADEGMEMRRRMWGLRRCGLQCKTFEGYARAGRGVEIEQKRRREGVSECRNGDASSYSIGVWNCRRSWPPGAAAYARLS